jgi:hypothetical protein
MGLMTVGLLALARPAQAVPVLQLYIEGAVYNSSTESWSVTIPESGTIRLWAIGNVSGEGSHGAISDVKLSIAYAATDSPTFTVAPTRIGGTGSYNGFTDPSTSGAIGAVVQGAPGTIPTLSDGSTLPNHGAFGDDIAWRQYGLGNFTLSDSPTADFINNFPTTMSAGGSQINAYDITIAGTGTVHFDLYNSVQYGNARNVRARSVNAPFSHDADGGGNEVPEGGSTAILLGLALLGFGGLRRKLRK